MSKIAVALPPDTISGVISKRKKSLSPSPSPRMVRCGRCAAPPDGTPMLGSALLFHLAKSISWAVKIELLSPVSSITAVPKSPTKTISSPSMVGAKSLARTKPLPSTTISLGSATMVLPPVCRISTLGASSSVISTSMMPGRVTSLFWPAT